MIDTRAFATPRKCIARWVCGGGTSNDDAQVM